MFVVNNFLSIPWTQGLNQKHEEYVQRHLVSRFLLITSCVLYIDIGIMPFTTACCELCKCWREKGQIRKISVNQLLWLRVKFTEKSVNFADQSVNFTEKSVQIKKKLSVYVALIRFRTHEPSFACQGGCYPWHGAPFNVPSDPTDIDITETIKGNITNIQSRTNENKNK